MQPRLRILFHRGIAVLYKRRGYAVDHEARDGCDISGDDTQRANAVDPHHGGSGITNDAARATSIRGCNDGGEITDMYLPLEHVPGHRAPYQGASNIVEEARQHENN